MLYNVIQCMTIVLQSMMQVTRAEGRRQVLRVLVARIYPPEGRNGAECDWNLNGHVHRLIRKFGDVELAIGYCKKVVEEKLALEP